MKLRCSLVVPVIAVLCGVALAVITAAYFVYASSMQTVLRASESDKAASIAFGVSSLIEGDIDTMRAASRTLQTNGDLSEYLSTYMSSGARLDELARYMDKVRKNLPGIDFIEVTDALEKTVYRSGSAGEEPRDSWGVAEALRGKETLVTQRGAQGLVIRATVPIGLDGTVHGTLTVGIVISDAFAKHIAEQTRADITFAMSHEILASSLPPARRTSIDPAALQRSVTEARPLYGHDATSQRTFVYLPQSLADETFGLVVGVDSSAISALMNQSEQRLLYVSAGILLFVVALGSICTVGLLRPLKQLRTKAEETVRDVFGEELHTARGNEISALVAGFNLMTGKLVDYTRELALACDSAETASRAKSLFLANMSHEIRTPMNGVLGMTELLLESGLTATQQRYAQTVRGSGETLLGIINDILDFSKIEAGKVELEKTEFDARVVIEDAVELLAAKAHAKGLDLTCDIDNCVPERLCGDPGRLRQILINLLGNAVKFTDSGEVAVRAALDDADGSDAVTLRVSVSDTGPGISADARERIFSAFTQADGSTTRKYGGTGLGLAISSELARIMGGAMSLESTPGQGSTFWFTVRLECAGGSLAPPLRPALAMSVLVASDNVSCRASLERSLARWSVRSASVAGGAEALTALRAAAARGERFDAVLLDFSDGAGFLAMLESDPECAATRAVLLCAIGAPRPQCSDTSACLRVNKPVRQAELYRALAECVGSAPRVLPAPTPTPAAPPTPPAALHARVLLVEDNVVNQKVAAAMLKSLGCEVVVAADGRASLAALDAHAFDLVFMDCQMPVMDGYEATAAIRRQEELCGGGRRLPIVALTANAIKGDRENCLAAGMDDYISKPFTKAQLHAMIERWAAVPCSAGPLALLG